LNEKSLLETIDEVERIIKKKKQAKYFAVVGFSFLLVHAFTHSPILLFIALALFGASIFRHIQVRVYANRNSQERILSPVDSDKIDEEVVDAKISPIFDGSNAVTSLSLHFDNSVYELSFLLKKEDWEDDDILLCKSNDREVNLHPASFLKYLESTDSDYFYNQDKSFIESLKDTPYLKFSYLEDSRNYPSITVEGGEVSVMCKYLSPIFYIFSKNKNVTLVVDELRDEDGEDIPPVIVSLKESVFLESAVEFCEEENAWIKI
jgi:hypothetical protein